MAACPLHGLPQHLATERKRSTIYSLFQTPIGQKEVYLLVRCPHCKSGIYLGWVYFGSTCIIFYTLTEQLSV